MVGVVSSRPVSYESVVVILSPVVMAVRDSSSVVVAGRDVDVLGGVLVLFGRDVTSVVGISLVVISTLVGVVGWTFSFVGLDDSLVGVLTDVLEDIGVPSSPVVVVKRDSELVVLP